MGELFVKITDQGELYFEKEDKRKAYIYGLVCPISNRIRYVGKSVNPYERLKTHLNDARNSKLSKKAQWINDLSKSNEKPSIVILAEVYDENSEGAECDFIELFSEYSSDLTNSTKAAFSTHISRVSISHLPKDKQELAKSLINALGLTLELKVKA